MSYKVQPQKSRASEGFSVLELLVVMGIIVVMSTAVVMQYRSAQVLLAADAVQGQVASQMRYARKIAVDQRRTVQIDFVSPQTIQILRWDDADNSTLMADVDLESGYSFSMPAGAGDTPDGFGNDSAVYFAEADVTGGLFLADGRFVDDEGALLNGTVFTMGGNTGTARAATLSGATGRVKKYQWANSAWEGQ